MDDDHQDLEKAMLAAADNYSMTIHGYALEDLIMMS